MALPAVLLRAQELSGKWAVIGSNRGRGVPLEDDLQIVSDMWGTREIRCTTKRDPRRIWNDLTPFTPIECLVNGMTVGSGRLSETPTHDGSERLITLSGNGWQHHLDDDFYQRVYVETDLSKFSDQRQLLGSNLKAARAAGIVATESGVITIGLPNAFAVVTGDYVGVTLDLGPDNLAKRVVVSYLRRTGTCNDGTTTFFVRGHDTQDCIPVGDTDFSVVINAITVDVVQTSAVTFTTPRRYVSLFLFYTGVGGTYGQDQTLKITGAQVFAATAYESGNASILKASDVVKDARDKATLLLDPSNAKITATSFSIPEFSMSQYATPRDVINSVNAYHGFQPRVTVDRVLEYRALPAGPIFDAGEAITFEDASANSGADIYSSALVEATGPDGTPVVARIDQAPGLTAVSAIQPTNPTFAVDASNWTNAVRDTVTFDTAPAAGQQVLAAGDFNPIRTTAWTGGAFVVGKSYYIVCRGFIAAGTSPAGYPFVTASVKDTATGALLGSKTLPGTGAWVTLAFSFTAISTTGPTLGLYTDNGSGAPLKGSIDSITLFEAAASIPQRRGFRRTLRIPTNMSLTAAAAQQIGQVALASHRTTPLRGKISVVGAGPITRSRGGTPVTPWELLLYTGELIRLPHLINPDTGDRGREGRIVQVSCRPLQMAADIDLDSGRSNFDALIARLGILTGQVK